MNGGLQCCARWCKKCGKRVAVGSICFGMGVGAFDAGFASLCAMPQPTPAVASSSDKKHPVEAETAEQPHTHTDFNTDPIPNSAQRPELMSGSATAGGLLPMVQVVSAHDFHPDMAYPRPQVISSGVRLPPPPSIIQPLIAAGASSDLLVALNHPQPVILSGARPGR
jgi:hypothetical protein